MTTLNLHTDKNNRLLRNIIFTLIFFIIAIFVINMYSMYRLRTITLDNHLSIASTHARGFESYLSEKLAVLDLLCATLLLIDPELKNPTKKEQIDAVLQANLMRSPLLRSISLVNKDNNIVISTDNQNIGMHIDLSTYYQHSMTIHSQNIGLPTLGHDLYQSNNSHAESLPHYTDEYYIPIAYTLNTNSDVYHLIATLNTNYLTFKMNDIIQLQHSTVSILRKDGTILFSTDEHEQIGRKFKSVAINEFDSNIDTMIEKQNDTDLIAFKATDFYPFIIMAKFSKQQALVSWVNECKMIIAMLTPMFLGLIVLAVLYLQRQNQLIQQQIKNITLEEQAQFFQIEARYDPLTQLPNRSYLYEQLVLEMADANRYGYKLAIAFLDLDGFKKINDTYGHNAGDILLTPLAKRFSHCLRHGDILARIGGDEFVAVCKHIISTDEIEPIANRLLAAAVEPVTFENNQLQVSVSIGFAMYNRIPITADDIVDLADIAMYKAKRNGKNRWYVYSDE